MTSIEQGKYTIKISCELSSADNELVAKYGDPYVQVGGTFLDEDTGFSFTLEESLIKLKAQFRKYTKFFDANDLGNSEAEKRANLFEKTIRKRLETALEILRNSSDTFSTHKRYTV